MQRIELDATPWRTRDEFYDALFQVLEAPEWHGRNLNPLVDSMIWGGINELKSPYTIAIMNAERVSADVGDEIRHAVDAIRSGRSDFRERRGEEADVYLKTDTV